MDSESAKQVARRSGLLHARADQSSAATIGEKPGIPWLPETMPRIARVIGIRC